MQKQVSVVVPEGLVKDMVITPGTTTNDILQSLNLSDYSLSRQSGGAPFSQSADLFNAVGNHEKLYASPTHLEVGF